MVVLWSYWLSIIIVYYFRFGEKLRYSGVVKLLRLFKDYKVFTDTYIPPNLINREEKLSRLVDFYRYITESPGEFSRIAVIYGTVRGRSGIGKTTLAKLTAARIAELARRNGFTVKPVYVNVYSMTGVNQILTSITSQLGIRGVKPRGSSPIELMKAILDDSIMRNYYILLIIDEIQSILRRRGFSEEQLIYLFFRYTEIFEGIVDSYRIYPLLVVFDMIEWGKMPGQLRSMVGLEVGLQPYKSYELYDILYDRIERGLVDPTRFPPALVEMISDYLGYDKSGEGNARTAISVSRQAVETAEARGDDAVREEYVREALSMVGTFKVSEYSVESLGLHQKILLYALTLLSLKTEGDWVTMGVLEDEYKTVCEWLNEKPRVHSQIFEYIRELSFKGLVQTSLSGRGMRGRTTLIRISPDIPVNPLKMLLEKELNMA